VLVCRARSAFGRFSPVLCLCFGPRPPTPLTRACASLGATDHPSPRLGLLVGVTPTCPERPFFRSLALSPVLMAKTMPSSSSGPPHRTWPASVTSDPMEPAPALSPATSPLRTVAAPATVSLTPKRLISVAHP
jgi:hypothetical protein